MYSVCVFFFKQKTAYEMRISDWSSDVCSSDLRPPGADLSTAVRREYPAPEQGRQIGHGKAQTAGVESGGEDRRGCGSGRTRRKAGGGGTRRDARRRSARREAPNRMRPHHAQAGATSDRKSTRLNSSH